MTDALTSQAARRLIVNADDFGFTRGVNEGILEAHRNGILTSTTLMADGPAFAHAVDLARATPTLDVGVHLVLWPEGALPQRLPAFLGQAARLSTNAIEAVFSRQVEKVAAAGITPSHLDTHKHTQILPHVMVAVIRTARRFGIRAVRRSLLPPGLPGGLRRRGLRTTDHFTGIGVTGNLNTATLAAELAALKPGTTELMCHPGRHDAELDASPTRLRREREVELEALTAPETRSRLAANTIELTSFREIP